MRVGAACICDKRGLAVQFFDTIFNYINDLTWGWALVPFLVVLGVFFTAASGFVQFRFFKRMFGVLWGDEDGDPSKISAREALFVSVGGRVGGGNIAGVAVAITAGGPGAVFWMWAIALVGMCSGLVEATLAQAYKRTEPNGILIAHFLGTFEQDVYGQQNSATQRCSSISS